MTALGGSLDSLTIDGREFSVASDNEVQRKLGGFENEVLANGNGTARIIKTRVPLQMNGLQIVTDDTRGDQEFLQTIADGSDFVAIALTYVSGETYQGSATIEGEFLASSQSATSTVNLSGPGILTRQ